MPRPMWKHTCSKNGSTHWMGTPKCRTCQQPGAYDGWQPTTHEAMAQYQTLYRLKPVGGHRRMTDELFASVRARCEACRGHGVRDNADRRSWQMCTACRGLGSVFIKPAAEVEELRGRVLAAHPDAAASPIRSIFAGLVVFAEATQEIIWDAVSSAGGVHCEPVFAIAKGGRQDVLTQVPLPADMLHLERVSLLAADSSPLEQLLLWQPTDPTDQYLRRFLLDFGHRVLAAERSRANAG
jgi:hypothetical protein